MELDRERVLKLVIVVLATLAALAVMSTLVQLVQTILPFLIVGAGIFAGYRWALSDAPAPSADEVESRRAASSAASAAPRKRSKPP